MTVALLAKWWWRFFSDKTTLWRSFLYAAYYKRRKPLMEGPTFRPYSQWWLSVLTTRDIFHCGIFFKIGDGSMVNLWKDRWCAQLSLQSMFPQIFNAVVRKNHQVQDCSSITGWRWRRILRGFIPSSTTDEDAIAELKELLSTTTLTNNGDEVRWRWNHSEVFTVKSLYNFLQESEVTEMNWERIWTTKIPLKVKIFGWLVLKRKVLTIDNLKKRGWSGLDTCALCLIDSESIDHLFLHCEVSRVILCCFMPNKRSLGACASVGDLWEKCSSKQGVLGRKESAILLASWWAIWLERNRRIFENQKCTMRQVIADLRALYNMWDSYCV